MLRFLDLLLKKCWSRQYWSVTTRARQAWWCYTKYGYVCFTANFGESKSWRGSFYCFQISVVIPPDVPRFLVLFWEAFDEFFKDFERELCLWRWEPLFAENFFFLLLLKIECAVVEMRTILALRITFRSFDAFQLLQTLMTSHGVAPSGSGISLSHLWDLIRNILRGAWEVPADGASEICPSLFKCWRGLNFASCLPLNLHGCKFKSSKRSSSFYVKMLADAVSLTLKVGLPLF